MVTVIIDKVSAHVMTEGDYNRIIKKEIQRNAHLLGSFV